MYNAHAVDAAGHDTLTIEAAERHFTSWQAIYVTQGKEAAYESMRYMATNADHYKKLADLIQDNAHEIGRRSSGRASAVWYFSERIFDAVEEFQVFKPEPATEPDTKADPEPATQEPEPVAADADPDTTTDAELQAREMRIIRKFQDPGAAMMNIRERLIKEISQDKNSDKAIALRHLCYTLDGEGAQRSINECLADLTGNALKWAKALVRFYIDSVGTGDHLIVTSFCKYVQRYYPLELAKPEQAKSKPIELPKPAPEPTGDLESAMKTLREHAATEKRQEVLNFCKRYVLPKPATELTSTQATLF